MVTYGVYCVAFGMQSAAGMTDSEESRSALRGQLADTTYLGVRFLLVSRAEGARAVILTYQESALLGHRVLFAVRHE